MVLRHRSLYGTFSIRRVPMGPAVTHSWCLQFIIKFSARYFLHTTCTCGTLLHPTYTCGTCSYSSMMLVIHHKSLRFVLSPSDVYVRNPSASDLWDPMAYMSRVPVGPFSISIRSVGPDGLRVTCTMCAVGVEFLKKRSDTFESNMGSGPRIGASLPLR